MKEAIKSLEEEFDVEIPVYVTIGKLKDSGEEKLRVTCKSCEDEKFKLEETERTSKIQSQIKSRQDKLMKLANKNAREFPDAIHLKRDVIQVAGKEKLGVLRCGICNGIIKGSKTPCSKDIKQHMKSNMHSSGRLTEKARELNMVLIDRCLNDYIKASGSELELSLDAIKFRVHLTRAFLAMGIPLCKADNVELQEFLQQYTKYRFAGRRGLTRWVELVSRIEREEVAEQLQGNSADLTLVTDGGDVGGKKIEGVLIRRIHEDGTIITKMIACKVMEGGCKAEEYYSLMVRSLAQVKLDSNRLSFCVSDSLRSNIKGLTLLSNSERGSGEENDKLQVIACWSHFFNNAGKLFSQMKELNQFMSCLNTMLQGKYGKI